jgi:hypothetical protein
MMLLFKGCTTKPTVDSDNNVNLQTESKKPSQSCLKQIRKKYQKFNFKTKSDIVSSNSNQNQVVVSINNLLKKSISDNSIQELNY